MSQQEFGGRNLIIPNARKEIRAYLESEDLQLIFPQAIVDVLAGERTFWEKITLLHSESNRETFRANRGTFRHWYDVSKLIKNEIGTRALKDIKLLESVVHTKTILYPSKHAQYELCLQKHFRLISEEEGVQLLKDDFKSMLSSGMFFEGELPSFDEVMGEIQPLQSRLNGQ